MCVCLAVPGEGRRCEERGTLRRRGRAAGGSPRAARRDAAPSITGAAGLSAPSAALMGCAGPEPSKPNEMLNKIKGRVKWQPGIGRGTKRLPAGSHHRPGGTAGSCWALAGGRWQPAWWPLDPQEGQPGGPKGCRCQQLLGPPRAGHGAGSMQGAQQGHPRVGKVGLGGHRGGCNQLRAAAGKVSPSFLHHGSLDLITPYPPHLQWLHHSSFTQPHTRCGPQPRSPF